MKTEDDLIVEFCQVNGINPKSGLGWMRNIVTDSLAFEQFVRERSHHLVLKDDGSRAGGGNYNANNPERVEHAKRKKTVG